MSKNDKVDRNDHRGFFHGDRGGNKKKCKRTTGEQVAVRGCRITSREASGGREDSCRQPRAGRCLWGEGSTHGA